MHKLIVVGTGIKALAHLTEETKKVIQIADKTLYLVNSEAMKQWLEREAKIAESLDPLYFTYKKRVDAYYQITNYILSQYKTVSILCVVFYGHPVIMANSALAAIKKINEQGGQAIILPAVSAIDCLFADLQIDPGNGGCLLIDATELLLYERVMDTYAHTILGQIGNLGTYDHSLSHKISLLSEYLIKYYSYNHRVCLYEAATLPLTKSRIEWVSLNHLVSCPITANTTLYIPPSKNKEVSQKYLSLFNIDKKDFILTK